MTLSRRPHDGDVPRAYKWQGRCHECRTIEIVKGVGATEAGRNLKALGWRGFGSGKGAVWICGICLEGNRTVTTLAEAKKVLGHHYDLSIDEVHSALAWTRTAKRAAALREELDREISVSKPALSLVPSPPDKTWCGQCEQRVTAEQSAACQSAWCKAKAHHVALGSQIPAHEADKARAGR